MIVDRILDRKDGTPYNAKAFYDYCMEEQTVFGYYIGGEIATAMDIKRNEQVQAALCKYIMEQGYNPEICDYINAQNWIDDEKLNPMCENCKRLGKVDECGHLCRGTTEQHWTGCVYRKV